MFRVILILLLIQSANTASTQSIGFKKEINLNFKIDNASIDRNSNLFLTTKGGDVHKYSSNGDSIISYSPRKKANVSLIEAWSGLKVFLFFHDLQEYMLLDRFLRPSPFYSFDSRHILFSGIATIAGDENIWVLDPGDFSLKKYNSISNVVEFSTPLDLLLPIEDYNITFIREYQNLLFIVDANTGIHIMDNMGNYQKNIPITNLNHIGFIANQIYFLDANTISTFHIYNGATGTIKIPSEVNIDPDFVLIGDQNVYLLAGYRLLIFELINPD